MTINTANELLSKTRSVLEEQERKQIIERFIINFNRLSSSAANEGNLGVYIDLKAFPLKYHQDIFDMLEDNGFEYEYCPILDKYFITWG